ncbi:hypothetical protein GOBAR_DD08510 [Gossypium barbadense]|nr:hypothetical protein GOBAR_DD08510 [Gossypium barbadense]
MSGNGASSSSLNMISGEDVVNNNLSALVVDDSPLLRLLHDIHLKKYGLKVQVAENGKVAVDLFHLGASFDLVLMDKEMPVMNGVEATKELRAMGVTSMIVGVTSKDGPDTDSEHLNLVQKGEKVVTEEEWCTIFNIH